MSGLQFGLASAAALLLLTAGAPRALALAQNGGTTPPPTYPVSQITVNLSPIVVYGRKLALPIVLQAVKKALSRPWSSDPADADKMVCQFEEPTGSHFETLYCQTNRNHFKQQDRTQLALVQAVSGSGGGLNIEIANWARNQHWINVGAMKELLKKLPPADSSYTLRVTDHGKPFIDYVVKDGELVKMLKYPQAGQTSH